MNQVNSRNNLKHRIHLYKRLVCSKSKSNNQRKRLKKSDMIKRFLFKVLFIGN